MKRKKILIVDDEKELLELLAERLHELEEYQISVAASGDEFRRAVEREKPDLIILDIMLGDANGAILYDELCAEVLDDKVPVIFLSALNEGHPNEHARSGRRYSLLTKPFVFEELAEEIRQLTNSIDDL